MTDQVSSVVPESQDHISAIFVLEVIGAVGRSSGPGGAWELSARVCRRRNRLPVGSYPGSPSDPRPIRRGVSLAEVEVLWISARAADSGHALTNGAPAP